MARPTFFLVRLRAEPGQEIRDTPPTDELPPTTTTEKKLTLEEKMKSWEATEEERKAASLGGLIPTTASRERTGVFYVGLYIAFPLMVLSGLAFALFPLIVGNLDVDSVGPPPTM
jgi:hypothetical protein